MYIRDNKLQRGYLKRPVFLDTVLFPSISSIYLLKEKKMIMDYVIAGEPEMVFGILT